MPSSDPVLILVGPTAVGKTECSIRLAERLGGEVISADSRLFYRGMDIGTAKPTPSERARVPHHLIDIARPDETISLAEFQRLAAEAILQVHGRGRLPIVVGGTGQYIRALTEGWSPPQVVPDERLRDVLNRLAGLHGAAWLHDKLRILDPAAAGFVDARNARRSIRALEVIFSSGRRFSDQRNRIPVLRQGLTIGLARPRPELYARIDARIQSMFAAGLLEEVRQLLEAGYDPALPSFSAIGYRECVRVIRGEWTSDQAAAEIRRATRVFVRRQANWFKPVDPSIHWLDAGSPDLLEQVESRLHRDPAHPPIIDG